MRVLVVDDHSMTRTLLKKTLEEMGFEGIEMAVDGAEAVEKLKEFNESGNPFQIVFVDWNMPNMTGIEMIKLCKADEELSKPAYIMVTAEREQDSVVEALKAGVSDYIVKPFSAEQIRSKVTSIIGRMLVA